MTGPKAADDHLRTLFCDNHVNIEIRIQGMFLPSKCPVPDVRLRTLFCDIFERKSLVLSTLKCKLKLIFKFKMSSSKYVSTA